MSDTTVLAVAVVSPVENWSSLVSWLRDVAGASLLAQHHGHTRRAYARHIADFCAWLAQHERRILDRQTMGDYRSALEKDALAPSSINQTLAALRGLIREAAELGVIDERLAESIARVKGPAQRGQRLGNWVTRLEAEAILGKPDRERLKGIRDRAILGLLFGCGLRRVEVAELAWKQLQTRDGHHVLADITGKHGRVRTVKLPVWTWRRIEEWRAARGSGDGRMFRSINKGDRLCGESLSAQAIRDVVKEHAPNLAPHDARRSFSRLARQGGATLEQIQLALGHSSVATTERYLGTTLDLDRNAVDYTGLGEASS
jgi:integrase